MKNQAPESNPNEIVVATDGRHLVVSLPLQFKRRSGRNRMLFASAIADATEKLPRNEPLVRLIACAYHWQELLESGRFASIRELAKAVGKNHSYIARLLRLTLLAPDIIEAILNGQEPSGLSRCKLFALPLEWEEQREALGMAILQ
jgi:hypothetical protein